MRKTFKINKNIVTYFLGLIILVISGSGVFNVIAFSAAGSFPESLQLKVPPSDIIGYRIDSDLRREEGIMVDYGKIISYAYRGDAQPMLADETFRTNYGQFFNKNKNNSFNEWTAKVYTGYTFDRKGDEWRVVEHATTTVEAFNRQISKKDRNKILAYQLVNKVYADTLPDFAGSGDGVSYNGGAGWDSIHDAVAGTVANYTATGLQFDSGKYGSTFEIDRVFFPFAGTETLPDSALISSSTMHFYEESGYSGTQQSYTLVQTTQNATTSLTTADFDNAGSINNPTEGANRVAWGSSAGWVSMTLNDNGKNWINTIGTTKLGLRMSKDADDVEPTTNDYTGNVLFSEYSGTAYDPYLLIDYSIPTPAVATQVRKESDQSTSNNSVFFSDDELKINLTETNTSYIVDGFIFAKAGSQQPDIKIRFMPPSSADMDLAFIAHDSGDSGVLESGTENSGEITIASSIDEEIIQITGTIKTNTATGTLYFQWAQNNSHADSTAVKTGSYLRVQKIQ